MDNTEKQGVKERIKQFIMFKNISTREFERQVGVSYGFIGNMSKSTSPEKITKISHCFPDLNIAWLLTGQGEMLKQPERPPIGFRQGEHTNTGADPLDMLIAQQSELVRQYSELIRQHGELIDMLKQRQAKD